MGGLVGSLAFPSENVIVSEKLVELECAEIVFPEIENADNLLLNDFLESQFSEEYAEIKDEAEYYALEELEDHDYRVVVNYLKSLIVGLDENSIDVDIEETYLKVVLLGLNEDEDKSARVTFDIEVEYEFEEGINEYYKIDFVVVYDVAFEEGDFNDEDVELVSIQSQYKV